MPLLSEVLVVDDNVADVYLASEALHLASANTHVANVGDGEQALAYLRREGTYAEAPRPDVVILDLALPRKSGDAVLAELRSDPRLQKLPVVIFSTSRSNRDIVRSYELGANCFLTKPGTLDEFVSTVQLIGSFFGSNDGSKGERWNDPKATYC